MPRTKTDPLDATFLKPIALADGGKLTTLRDAKAYIDRLPRKIAAQDAWAEARRLIDRAVSEGPAWSAFAGMAVNRAIHGPADAGPPAGKPGNTRPTRLPGRPTWNGAKRASDGRPFPVKRDVSRRRTESGPRLHGRKAVSRGWDRLNFHFKDF